MALTQLSKVNRNRFLGAQAQHVESRSRALARLIAQILQRHAALIIEQEIGRDVRKQDNEDDLRTELAELLRLFGLRQATDSGTNVLGFAPPLDGQAVQDFLADKEVLVQGIMDQTRTEVRSGMRELIASSLAETPTPSSGEVARRIRSQFFGPIDQADFTVSSERAALIARTELVQAENSGIFAGYEATGVEQIEWLAYTDGRSGDRHHERMDGVVVNVGELFVTPLNNQMRYPGDPNAPIKETANCRCTIAPVIGGIRSG